jgi:NADPH-dependent glutamate synthase beta subunit-like oxidoreductase
MNREQNIALTLRNGEQADIEGIMVIVSRQACEEAADLIDPPDGRPCNTDVFLAAALRCLDHNDIPTAVTDWVEGNWSDAMEGVTL